MIKPPGLFQTMHHIMSVLYPKAKKGKSSLFYFFSHIRTEILLLFASNVLHKPNTSFETIFILLDFHLQKTLNLNILFIFL